MIEYIVPGNIDDRILTRAAKLLGEGGIAALPTDTNWSIVCSIRSREGLKRLKSLSGMRDERHFTLLCSSISQFGEFCSLDNTRFRLIKRLTPGPYVFILKTLLGTEKALGLRRKEIGVRLPGNPIPVSLIETLKCPLYSITAKREMAAGENGSSDDDSFYREETLFEGGWELEGITGLDIILDSGEDRSRIFSTVLDLIEDEVTMIRQGAGEWPV
ncbi:MAG: Sua5/YciO/YrdC/YwlC family protein [Treponema sp.]|jgi:tRNA threonylcarbamoyl adenosine modification protein (Sua5/YciO/YrdC/YwlC family)|nr:Sua5/YciO/YrdC/YwlC family protein [Treponema sp.]